MTTSYILGFIGAALMVASYLMKSMLPLRLVALAANAFLVGYAWLGSAWPTMVLYVAMIPINLHKVSEVRKLVRAMQRAKVDSPLSEWLLPHMSRREARVGTTLWRKDDVASELVYVDSGSLRLVEHDVALDPGSLVGEIGLLAPDNRHSGTIVCETDCTLYTMSGGALAQLYYLNPAIGFHVMRLVVARLLRDAERAREGARGSAAA